MTRPRCPTCNDQGYLPRYPDGMTLVEECPACPGPGPGLWTRVYRWLRRIGK